MLSEWAIEHISKILDVDTGWSHNFREVLENKGLRGWLNTHLQLRHLSCQTLHFFDSWQEILCLCCKIFRHLNHGSLKNLIRLGIVVRLMWEFLTGATRLHVDFGSTTEGYEIGERPLFKLLFHLFMFFLNFLESFEIFLCKEAQ